MSNDLKHFSYVNASLELIGLTVGQRSSNRYIFQKYVSLPGTIVLVLLILYNFRYAIDMYDFTEDSEALSTFGHILVRKILLLVYAPLLDQLYHNRLSFWKYDLFGKILGDKIRREMLRAAGICFSLTLLSVGLVLYYSVIPFFYDNINVPQASWVPKGKFYLCIVYLSQVYCLVEFPLITCCFDALFFLMCKELTVQFTFLKKALQSIRISEESSLEREETCLNGLKKCAAYHYFLLQVHSKLNKVYSIFFCFQYVLSVEGICIKLYMLHDKSATLGQIILTVFYIQGILMQCSFTFLSASNVEMETQGLSDEIYAVDWYNSKNRKISQHIRFMMINAQRPICFTGAGLFYVNRTVFLQIVRIGVSISTLLRKSTAL